MKQSALLIHLLREIEQGVQHKSLLPTILHQKDINKLLYSSITLPDWFDHVFSKEYEKEKINLETIANKMYKLHGLSEVIFDQIKEKLSTSQVSLEHGDSFEKVWKFELKRTWKFGYHRVSWEFSVFVQILQRDL